MEDKDGAAHTNKLRERTLALLDAHCLPATPENYAFWFAYAGERHPEINRAVDGLIRRGRPLTEDGLALLYAQASSSDNNVRQLSSQVASGLDVLLDLITRANGNVREFGTSLEIADRQLGGDRAGLDVEALTGLLLEACRHTLLRNARIEQQLEEAQRQITSLQENVVSLSQDASTDALTGLLNRRAFDTALSMLVDEAQRSGSSLSLVIGDLDGFKLFNDTYGHQLGDQVLKFTASAMTSLAREGDVICRYGGEEFALLFPGTDLEAAVQLAERIRAAIRKRVIVKRGTGEKIGRVSMSFGVAQLARDGSSDSLIRAADQRLYAAKQAGRNRVIPAASGQPVLR